MHSIVLIIFYIGIFLSVSGFGHAICNSSRNQHAVILLDMMLRARIAIMNMRAMDGGDCDRKYHNEKRKKVEREKKEQEVSQGSEFHDFDSNNNDDKHDMIFGSSGVLLVFSSHHAASVPIGERHTTFSFRLVSGFGIACSAPWMAQSFPTMGTLQSFQTASATKCCPSERR